MLELMRGLSSGFLTPNPGPSFHSMLFGQLHPALPFVLMVMLTIKTLRELYHFLWTWYSGSLAPPNTLVKQVSVLIYNCWRNSWTWRTKSVLWGRKKAEIWETGTIMDLGRRKWKSIKLKVLEKQWSKR